MLIKKLRIRKKSRRKRGKLKFLKKNINLCSSYLGKRLMKRRRRRRLRKNSPPKNNKVKKYRQIKSKHRNQNKILSKRKEK